MQQWKAVAATAGAHAGSFLSVAGSAIGTMVRHVPTRAVLWAMLGVAVGVGTVCLSLLLTWLTVENGVSRLLGLPYVVVLALMPVVGLVLFGLHGAYRGAARAALEIEGRLGLVDYLVDRVMSIVDTQVGKPLANLPLASVESTLKEATHRYLGSDDAHEGRGLVGWILRRAKRAVMSGLDTVLLSAYRAEAQASGGGGIDMAKVTARAKQEVSARMEDLLMAPLQAQRRLLFVLYIGLGSLWFPLLLGITGLIRTLGS